MPSKWTTAHTIYWNTCTYVCAARSVNLIKHSYCGCEELPGSNCDVGFLGDRNQLIVFHHIALSLPEPSADLILLLYKNQGAVSPPTLFTLTHKRIYCTGRKRKYPARNKDWRYRRSAAQFVLYDPSKSVACVSLWKSLGTGCYCGQNGIYRVLQNVHIK